MPHVPDERCLQAYSLHWIWCRISAHSVEYYSRSQRSNSDWIFFTLVWSLRNRATGMWSRMWLSDNLYILLHVLLLGAPQSFIIPYGVCINYTAICIVEDVERLAFKGRTVLNWVWNKSKLWTGFNWLRIWAYMKMEMNSTYFSDYYILRRDCVRRFIAHLPTQPCDNCCVTKTEIILKTMYSDLQGMRIYICKSRYYFEFKKVHKWNSLAKERRIV